MNNQIVTYILAYAVLLGLFISPAMIFFLLRNRKSMRFLIFIITSTLTLTLLATYFAYLQDNPKDLGIGWPLKVIFQIPIIIIYSIIVYFVGRGIERYISLKD